MENLLSTPKRLLTLGQQALVAAKSFNWRQRSEWEALAAKAVDLGFVGRDTVAEYLEQRGITLDTEKLRGKLHAGVDSLTKPRELHGSVTINQTLAAVDSLMRSGAVAGLPSKNLAPGKGPHQFVTEIDGRMWHLELTKVARGKHTRVRLNTAAPSHLDSLTHGIRQREQHNFADKILRDLKVFAETGEVAATDAAHAKHGIVASAVDLVHDTVQFAKEVGQAVAQVH